MKTNKSNTEIEKRRINRDFKTVVKDIMIYESL